MLPNNRRNNWEEFRNACLSGLRQANKKRLKSVVFIISDLKLEELSLIARAKILSQEIFRHLREDDSKLLDIIIVVSNEEVFDEFKDTVYFYLEHIVHKVSNGPFSTVDIIIEIDGAIVLIERSNPPFGWALPGGFVDYGESLEQTVVREVKEETNLKLISPKQMHTYSKPGRDPRFFTVTTVFTASGKGKLRSGDDAKGARVIKHKDLMKFDYAFDHKDVIRDYLKLKNKGC